MTDLQKATFQLTSAQARKLKKSEPFQLSHAQLTGNGLKSTHEAELHMTPKDAKAVMKAIDKGKGYRFKPEKIQGGSLNIKKVLKDPLSKAIAKKVVDVTTKALVDKGKISQAQANSANSIADKAISGDVKGAKAEAINALEGGEIEGGMFSWKNGRIRGNFDAKNSMLGLKLGLDISKKVVVQPNVLGAVATGNAPLFVAALGANAVNLALKQKGIKAKISDKQALSAVNTISKTIDATNNPTAIAGSGIQHYQKKFVKGSPEAKAHMASIRAQKKGAVKAEPAKAKPKAKAKGKSKKANISLEGVSGGSMLPLGAYQVQGNGFIPVA